MRFGSILSLRWYCTDASLALRWHYAGIKRLAPHWHCTSGALVLYWRYAATPLVMHWHCGCTALAMCWYFTGTALVLHCYYTGKALALHCHFNGTDVYCTGRKQILPSTLRWCFTSTMLAIHSSILALSRRYAGTTLALRLYWAGASTVRLQQQQRQQQRVCERFWCISNTMAAKRKSSTNATPRQSKDISKSDP